MEMLDKFLYTFFGKLDDAIAFVETYVIKMTEWCWHTRVKLLKKSDFNSIVSPIRPATIFRSKKRIPKKINKTIIK